MKARRSGDIPIPSNPVTPNPTLLKLPAPLHIPVERLGLWTQKQSLAVSVKPSTQHPVALALDSPLFPLRSFALSPPHPTQFTV